MFVIIITVLDTIKIVQIKYETYLSKQGSKQNKI